MVRINMLSIVKNGRKYYRFSEYPKKLKKKALAEALRFRNKGRKSFIKLTFGSVYRVYATRLKSDRIVNGKIST
ncbi:hypothetical protein KAT51_00870 [bacterium]|nr:hypothetical protein [bacterium]